MHLKLDRVTRNFGHQIAVRDVSTTIEPGSIVAVLGANGAGKSTLLKLIAGWLPVATGRITLGSRLVKPSRAELRRSLHLIETPSRSANSCTGPIFDMVSDYQLARAELPDEVADWFERLNLVGVYGKSSQAISKGQRYKIALIGLFLVAPHVWLLDEPFSSGLDANGLQVLQEQIRRHARQGGIVVFSTQWPEQAKQLADLLLVLEAGELVWDAPVDRAPDGSLIRSASQSLRAVLQGISDDV